MLSKVKQDFLKAVIQPYSGSMTKYMANLFVEENEDEIFKKPNLPVLLEKFSNKTIVEYNKLIATSKFVNAEAIEYYAFNQEIGYNTYHYTYPMSKEDKTAYPNNYRYHIASSLKYHLSLDWLTPVVEKIALLEDDKSKQCVEDYKQNIFDMFNAYMVVVNYLK